MCIINVYGPTSWRQQQFPEEAEAYYDALYTQHSKSNYIVIMAGDFNIKLGLKRYHKSFMRFYGKGTREDTLAEFMIEHNIYKSNTKFCKAMRHRTK